MKVVNGGLVREKKEGLGGVVAVCGGGWRERERERVLVKEGF